MICNVCGTEYEGNFCPVCGAKAEPESQAPTQSPTATESQAPTQSPTATESQAPAPSAASQGQSAAPKSSHKGLWIGLICGAFSLMALFIIILVLILTYKPSINLNQYVEVTFDGYEGLGEAHATFDYKQLEKDYEGKIKIE